MCLLYNSCKKQKYVVSLVLNLISVLFRLQFKKRSKIDFTTENIFLFYNESKLLKLSVLFRRCYGYMLCNARVMHE